ncbi:MAG TPA: NAD(P)H-binding protein [Flavisolibacter sp.]|nr:NAD(P)H-binding protein [Flavisolibacter sp.]
MTTNGRTAIILGATGLVGSHLVNLLLQDERFEKIKLFTRRSAGISHKKLDGSVIDFDRPAEWRSAVQGDVLFSALGTTLAQAGSKEAQFKIDYSYQFEFAAAAAENGVPVYVLVSSAMASPQSRIFYTRMKGELERDIKKLPFRYIRILQPGMLSGKRQKERRGERIGLRVIHWLNHIGIAKKQRPIDAGIVARAMINAAFAPGATVETYTLLDVFHLAGVEA